MPQSGTEETLHTFPAPATPGMDNPTMTECENYDVIVIGGGPAGSATATFIAQGGCGVALFERQRFPRFRIGESLMPATYWSLERLGVLEKMRCSHFPHKRSVQFFSKSGRAAVPFYFSETQPGPSSQTWQVDRCEFDQMLLENSRNQGVEVYQEARVVDVLFDGQRAHAVRVRFKDGSERELGARVVVDATGQSTFLARRLKLKQGDPNLMQSSFFTRYRGAWRAQGIDEGATLILYTAEPRTWFWYIPLPGEIVSVGVVGPLDRLVKGRDGTPQQVFEQELAKCPAVHERIRGAEQIQDVSVLKDFSYTSRRIAGDGWVLVGDAFGFLDPIYSSGVFLALKGGEFAADSILAALRQNDLSAAALGRHGEQFLAGVEAFRKLVYAYYSQDFNFADFLRRFPERKDDLVNLLIGNVYTKDVTGLLESMDEFCHLPGYQPFRIEESVPGEANG